MVEANQKGHSAIVESEKVKSTGSGLRDEGYVYMHNTPIYSSISLCFLLNHELKLVCIPYSGFWLKL